MIFYCWNNEFPKMVWCLDYLNDGLNDGKSLKIKMAIDCLEIGNLFLNSEWGTNETNDVIYSICCPDQYSSKSDCMASCRVCMLYAYVSCVYPTERKCKIGAK